MQNPDAQHRMKKHNTQYKNKYINRHPAKQNWRRIVEVITVVPKEASVPFGFNCWQSSLPSSEQIFITGNSLCSAIQNQNHYCHTDNQLHKCCDSQTCSTFLYSNCYPFYTYNPDIPICYYVYGVYESLMSLNVLIISFVFLWVRWPAHSENTQCYFLVWAYREQCVQCVT